MGWMFAIVVVIALMMVAATYHFSSRWAGHVMLANGFLWVLGIALFWLNTSIFPPDETRREMGEFVAVAPLIVAIPMIFIAIICVLLGLKIRKKA